MLNIFVRNGWDPILKEAMAKLRLSRTKDIRVWIERSIANENPYKNWKSKYIIEDGVGDLPNQYFEWDLQRKEVQHLDNSMRCLWWHCIHESQNFCLMQNPLPLKDQTVVFEDSTSQVDLPDLFHRIDCFNSYDSLINYCRQNNIIRFSLHDTTQFKHDKSIPLPKGSEVYCEIATRRLWYKDTLHKDHFEIYDHIGRKHIAEADINGIVDYSKADPTKHPIK